MSGAEQTKAFGEHQQDKARRQAQRWTETVVQEAIKEGNRALVTGDVYRVACICRDKLLPATGVSKWTIDDYHDILSESHLAWDWDAVDTLLEHPGDLVARAAAIDGGLGQLDTVERQSFRSRAHKPGTEAVTQDVTRAFKSLESAAVADQYIPGELSQSTDVFGHELRLGLKWQSFDYETPDTMQVANPDLHPPFTLSIGDPGNGKSTAVDSVVEDAYAVGHKVVDILDMDELENGMYDVPSHQEDLVRARRDHDVPERFEDHPEYEQPRLEILHPLCSGLCSADLPYDTDDERFVARPFVIPVADLDLRVLKATMHLTEAREQALDNALERMSGDWSLGDLESAVFRSSSESRVTSGLLSEIQTLQNTGFFATRAHEYAIDWEAIFQDTETITTFSCSMLEQERHKDMVLGYLLDAIYEERMPAPPDGSDVDEVTSYARALMVCREMQAIAPSQRKLKGMSGSAARLKNLLLSKVQKLGEKRRHVDLGIIGDTQKWLQVSAGVRENVDRVLMFHLQTGIAQQVFAKLTGDDQYRHASSVSEFDVGTCCVLGSQWLSTNQPFAMPIDWLPPMCHHLDAEDDSEPDGWRARVQYKDSEEFRSSPYTMGGDGGTSKTPGALEDDEDDDADSEDSDGIGQFLDHCVIFSTAEDDDFRCAIGDLYGAYHDWADQHGLEVPDSRIEFGRQFRAVVDEESAPKGRTRSSEGPTDDRRPCYRNLTLSEEGKTRLSRAKESGVEPGIHPFDPEE